LSLHIEELESQGIVILDLKSPLTLGHGDPELRDRLPALHQSGKVDIMLTKLAIAFEFFADEQEAIDSFFPDREMEHFDVLASVQHEGDTAFERQRALRGGLLK